MSLLKKENWIVNLLLMVIGQNVYILVQAYLLKSFKKGAWYTQPIYWIVGVLCCFFPAVLMLYVLTIQMLCENAKKLNVPGESIYATPYTWIVCFIVPVLGWALLIVMMLYLLVWTVVMLKKGEGEKYINE